MLILCAWMQKAGTAWYYSLTNDLLKAGGFHDANEIREKFELHSILKFNVCNIQQPTREKFGTYLPKMGYLESLRITRRDTKRRASP